MNNSARNVCLSTTFRYCPAVELDLHTCTRDDFNDDLIEHVKKAVNDILGHSNSNHILPLVKGEVIVKEDMRTITIELTCARKSVEYSVFSCVRASAEYFELVESIVKILLSDLEAFGIALVQ